MLYNECCEPTDIIFCSKTLRQPKDVSFWHQIQAHICYIRCLQIHFKGTGRLFWTLIGFKVCCPSCVCFLPLSYVCPLLSHNKTLFQIFRWPTISTDIYQLRMLFHTLKKRSNAHSMSPNIKVPQSFYQSCTYTHSGANVLSCDETDKEVT